MKTVKETIEKWNEIYDLVIAGAPDANNTSWQRVKDVFGIKEYPTEVISEFCTAWNKLSEEDADDDKKVWPLIMECIDGLLDNSTLYDYAFYIYNGEVGVLCEIDDKTIKAKGYESFNGIAFIPGYDIEEVLAGHLDTKPHLTNDDVYSGYTGCCDIDVQECRCIENEQHMELNWWTDAWAKSNEFVRELLVTTTKYYSWTSERKHMIDAIQQTLEKHNEELGWYNGIADDELDPDDIKKRDRWVESLKNCIKSHKEDWEKTCSNYEDPLGWRDYEHNTIDFENVYEEAISCGRYQELSYIVTKAAREAIESEES